MDQNLYSGISNLNQILRIYLLWPQVLNGKLCYLAIIPTPISVQISSESDRTIPTTNEPFVPVSNNMHINLCHKHPLISSFSEIH